MGDSTELSTVAAAERGRQAGKFDSPDARSVVGPLASAAALFLVAVTLTRKLLWGQESAPADPGNVVPDNLPADHAAIARADLLQLADDPDGNRLVEESVSVSAGKLVDHGNGTWAYIPELDSSGDATFNHRVSDGSARTGQTAALDLVVDDGGRNSFVGTDHNVIVASGGDDRIDAGSGDDAGNDTDSADYILGGSGDDLIDGGKGNDVIHASGGHDRVSAGDGDDVVHGDAGDDVMHGEAGNDVLFGDEGLDIILGGSGTDFLDGGGGDDSLEGGEGADLAKGGAGADVIVATIADGNDIYDGGRDVDTYDLSATTQGVVVDLQSGTARGAEIGIDSVANIENATGGRGDDVLISDDAANIFAGGDGNDTFVFKQAHAMPEGSDRWDRIRDFSTGDKIDMSRIDASDDEDGHQEFRLHLESGNPNDPKADEPGWIRFRYEQDDHGEHTIILARIRRDGRDDDMRIDLDGHVELTEDDFILSQYHSQA